MNGIIPKIVSFCVSLCFFLTSQACPAREIYTDDNTLKKTLDNGMVVVIHEAHKAPIASINVMVKAGSATEGRFSGSGISHLVEHMLFKTGSEKEQTNYHEIIKSLGGDMNGFTSHDYTGYTVTVPDKYVTEALSVLLALLTEPAFDALELKKEKEVVLDEIRRYKDNPARLASDLSWSLAYQEHPYRYPVLGYEDLFERIGKKGLEEYFSEKYTPQNMILTIAGNVRRDALLKEVEDMFGQIKRNFSPAASKINESAQLSGRSRTKYKSISLAHAILAYRSTSIYNKELYPLDILAAALGKGEDSILTKELRNKKRLVHNITCYNYTLRDTGLFYIYFTADPENVESAIEAIHKEIEKVKVDGLGEADLKKSKIMAKAEMMNMLETTEGRARDISTSEAVANDYKFSQKYLGKLFDVTSEEVKSAARANLKTESLNTVLVLPEEGKEASGPIGADSILERKVTKGMMPNGLRILTSEDHSTPTCSILALFLGGVRAENEKNNGITFLCAKLLLDGTEKRNEEDIKSEIESRGGRIGYTNGNNTFGVKVSLLSEDWRKAIEIVSDIVTNSVFSDEKIEKEKMLAFAAIKKRDDDIVRSGFLSFRQNFFKKHPYRFDERGTKETIQNIKRENIREYYDSLCVPGNMVLAVSGDINSEEVTAEVKKQFALFQERKPKLPNPPAQQIPIRKTEIADSMKREQSLVIIGFPSVRIADRDKYTFEVINSIMSGGGGRMYSNIRDEMGMAYSLGSSFQPGIEPGSFVFYALTSAKNVEAVKDAIFEEIKKIRNKAVPEEELESAKRYLISSTMSGLQDNMSFCYRISLDELYGLGYDNFEKYSERINSVTPGLIRRVAKQYFNTGNSVIVVVRGKEF
jgi:zinc protease